LVQQQRLSTTGGRAIERGISIMDLWPLYSIATNTMLSSSWKILISILGCINTRVTLAGLWFKWFNYLISSCSQQDPHGSCGGVHIRIRECRNHIYIREYRNHIYSTKSIEYSTLWEYLYNMYSTSMFTCSHIYAKRG
jgi:hypothetical protein